MHVSTWRRDGSSFSSRRTSATPVDAALLATRLGPPTQVLQWSQLNAPPLSAKKNEQIARAQKCPLNCGALLHGRLRGRPRRAKQPALRGGEPKRTSVAALETLATALSGYKS